MVTMFSKYKPLKALKKLVTGDREPEAENSRSFNVRQEKEEAYEAIERGTLMVPLEKIVGSVGRYHDFDNQFKTQQSKRNERLQGILKAMREGKNLPPIALYQIKEDFFILDGHHRFKAARELGHTHIRSRIVELLPSKNTFENNLYNEKIQFREKSKLADGIKLTEPGQFKHLEWQIEEHQKYLSGKEKQQISFPQAAADWYKSIYTPLYSLIEKSHLVKSFPRRTVDDLYLYISVHQWEKGKKRKYGIEIDKLIPTDMETFREQMAERIEQEYPEMKREITVFVLINIEGKYEQQLIDKLLALDEVQEVHAIHGSIDLLVKIILMRDILSSDAELISQFIQSTIRQWKGIVSSQTLIPGLSRVKAVDRCHL